MKTPLVEILYFEGCPNYREAQALVEQVAAEVGVAPEIRLIAVADAETAVRERFLGSPTVRVDGRDVEPGTETRNDCVYACRVYRTPDGVAGRPAAAWVRAALVS